MPRDLSSSRLEAFSDGVIAVIITIMVLDLHVPSMHDAGNRAAIFGDLKLIVVYLLSFVQIGIYWVNHHYLLDDLEHVTHGILWSNLALLFSLSLIPFGTQWIAVRGVEPVPVVVYTLCFLAPGATWAMLANIICKRTGVRPAASLGKAASFAGDRPGSDCGCLHLPVERLGYDRNRGICLAVATAPHRGANPASQPFSAIG